MPVVNIDRDPHSVNRTVPENWEDDVTPDKSMTSVLSQSATLPALPKLPPLPLDLPSDFPENFFANNPAKINQFQNWLRFVSCMDSTGFRNELLKLSTEEITMMRDIVASTNLIDSFSKIVVPVKVVPYVVPTTVSQIPKRNLSESEGQSQQSQRKKVRRKKLKP